MVLGFDAVWVGGGFTGQSIVFWGVFEVDSNASAENCPGFPDWGAVAIDVFYVVRTVKAEKARVGVVVGASRGGRVGKSASKFSGECVENQSALEVPDMTGNVCANISPWEVYAIAEG